jgi:hypothetical protein
MQNMFGGRIFRHCLIRFTPLLVLSLLAVNTWKNDTVMVAEFSNPLKNNKANKRRTFHDTNIAGSVSSKTNGHRQESQLVLQHDQKEIASLLSATKTLQDKTHNQLAYELATKWAHARFLNNTLHGDNDDGGNRKQQLHRRLATDLNELWQWEREDLNLTVGGNTMQLLNLVRIPKAGSSALSVTARALAGCHPDGYPCCAGFPGNKACPAPNLLCKSIVGCTNHNPKYNVFYTLGLQKGKHLPIITSLRHPASRAVSSFFYEWPHRPHNKCYSWQCFDESFMQKVQWQNPSTKMLVGLKAYEAVGPERYPIEAAKDRLCRTPFFGIAEWPIPSALLLYETHPFSKLQPNPVSFGLPANNQTLVDAAVEAARARVLAGLNYSSVQIEAKNSATGAAGLRQNQNEVYKNFKSSVFVQNNGTDLVLKHHAHDWELYQFAMRLFCARVRDARMMVAVQKDMPDLSPHFEPCIMSMPLQMPNASSAYSPGQRNEAAQLCTFARGL